MKKINWNMKELDKAELKKIVDSDYSGYKPGFLNLFFYMCILIGLPYLLDWSPFHPSGQPFHSVHRSTIAGLVLVIGIGYYFCVTLLWITLRKQAALIELLRKSNIIES